MEILSDVMYNNRAGLIKPSGLNGTSAYIGGLCLKYYFPGATEGRPAEKVQTGQPIYKSRGAPAAN